MEVLSTMTAVCRLMSSFCLDINAGHVQNICMFLVI